jgi:tol-pal system protein YbgF
MRVTAGVALAALLFAAPARAALFDDEEARKRIDATNQRLTQMQKQLEDRIATLETSIKNLGLVDVFNQIELLKSDSARLRGQIEVITHELDQAQQRQRDLYVDLDTRLRKIESMSVPPAMSAAPPPGTPAPSGVYPPGMAVTIPSTAAPAAGTPGAPATAVPPQVPAAPPPGALASATPRAGDATGEQRAYDGALDLFKNGNYGASIVGFTSFVKTYPRSPLAPSAQYWIGNAQFAQKDFRAAITAQRQLIAQYPDSQKVPDALLNIATSQIELGDTAAARQTLQEIVAKYPQSDAAPKAKQRLGTR